MREVSIWRKILLFWHDRAADEMKAKNMPNLFDCTQGTSDLLHSTAIEGTLGSFGHDNSSVQHVSNVSTKDIHKSSDPHRHHQRQDRPNPKNGLIENKKVESSGTKSQGKCTHVLHLIGL